MHTNNKVHQVNAVLQHPNPNKYFILANLGYSVVGTDEIQILECKTAGEHGAKLWCDKHHCIRTVSGIASIGSNR